MIETFFGADGLGTPTALFAAFAVGLVFGFALERAGFGSSRRLTGIFYFRDMTVLKVMFTGLLVGMLGLLYAMGLGWIRPESVYALPTQYGAQILGGLVFGIGFVMGGWCPGTAAVGVASGRVDAVIFLGGAVLGSMLFNETYGLVEGMTTGGSVSHAYDVLGVSATTFAFLFTLVAVVAFWFAELVEWVVSETGTYLNTRFLKGFSVALLVAAFGLFSFPAGEAGGGASAPAGTGILPSAGGASARAAEEEALLAGVAAAQDHVDPPDLADRMMKGEAGLVVVDVRPASEYARFHLRGAISVALPDLPASLAPYRNQGTIVLYSNGMTHPAQARDALARLGFANVFLLTDGLTGFVAECLKPASLRREPLAEERAARIRAWRAHFLGEGVRAGTEAAGKGPALFEGAVVPGFVDTAWLAANLGRADVKVLDTREGPAYSAAHVPGSLNVAVASLRGVIGGVPSMLLPPKMIAEHIGMMGIRPGDTVVVLYGDKLHDATLVALALARVGHERYAVLQGGFGRWKGEGRPVDARLPAVAFASYPLRLGADTFTVTAEQVLAASKDPEAVVLDVRPPAYFRGEKSDEARPGHVPGARNRFLEDDTVLVDGVRLLKSKEDLAAAYAAVLPGKGRPVYVHCRTGHQASQTVLVLRHLLGYEKVYWYDGGWTEWAAREELPARAGPN